MAIDFNAVDAPSDFTHIDVANSPDDEIVCEGRMVEIVAGPDSAPYGDLVVRLVGTPSGVWRVLEAVEPGYEHPAQIIGIRKTGSTVTDVRVWR